MGGGDGIEKVDGCVLHSMVAVDAEKLAARQWKGDSSASMMEPQEHSKGPGAQTLGDAGGVKGAYGGTWCIRGGSGRSTSSTRPTDPATRALEYGVLGPDGTGLESSMVETADESVGCGCGIFDMSSSVATLHSPPAFLFFTPRHLPLAVAFS